MENADKLTPLHWAAIKNQAQTARVLITNGAKVNHVDDLGITSLLYATSIDRGDTSVLESQLAAGIDRNVKDKNGRTPLELARAYQHSAIANCFWLGRRRPEDEWRWENCGRHRFLRQFPSVRDNSNSLTP